MTLCIVGFDDLVTSFVATIATGWSDPCRVGLSPTEKPRLNAAHHAGATTPAQRLGHIRSLNPAVSAFPERVTGSACASSFSRLARRSLALRPAHARCHRIS